MEPALEKDRPVINKARLRRWFKQLPFDEARHTVLPDGSDVAEMNSLNAIASTMHTCGSHFHTREK